METEQMRLLAELSPNASLTEIQTYVAKVLKLRGISGQPVQNSLLLLCEEVGELAKAIRKNTEGMSIEAGSDNFSVAEEMADVVIVLSEIANTLDISLADAFIAKEKINMNRNWEFTSGDKT
ncbi:MAG: hypothetical protein FWC76_05045 [Defluviitaleaceae bacterium]|nr:hypothetical protein [Defluviitaleaceae bacterium]